MVELYASVITGFEVVSSKEVTTAFGTDAHRGRGHVRFKLNQNRIQEALRLRSIDNLYVVLYDYELEELGTAFQEEIIDALQKIRNEISRINWKTAIECWQIAHGRQVPGGVEAVKEQMREYVKNGATGLNAQNSFSFRVTCNRAGEKSLHKFSSMDAARALGGQINNIFGWRPDMKTFDMEVIMNIRGNGILVMVALNKESLFKRNVCAFGPTTMRSTMCYCMTALAEPAEGEVIIDPMCGGGSIPLEGALAFPGCLFIGADIHPKALERCLANKRNCAQHLYQGTSKLEFLCCDATELPLRDNSVDAIITDLPFGKKIGSVEDNRILYPRLLIEWERLVKPNGRLVVMTHDKRSWERAIALHGGSWRSVSHYNVNVGGLQTLCHCLVNTKT
ncbi:unnamed protein product [Cylicocyclus nassatus]|uniref:THUMP domain-containing protein n=1 Tax=Cylicocyclus nassatus TaxID=53992 RepID=A0AA36M9G5_CYLNA|nr:unnamed protein product [Cylicocyclus nassatus]